MIISFSKFNESSLFDEEKPITIGSRVICNGSRLEYDDNGSSYYIDIKNQTGIVIGKGGHSCIVIFDNYFTKGLKDVGIRLNRGLVIDIKQIEHLDDDREKTTKSKQILFSNRIKSIIRSFEYIDTSFPININYIDITDKNDTISYIPIDRMDRLDGRDVWDNSLRQTMKIGRFIQILNPYTDKQSLDKKINIYKSAYNSLILKTSKFDLVDGEDILKWYNHKKYAEGSGPLNKSCMRREYERLSLYRDNPKKISMLILVNEEGKLMGRSLIWKVDIPNITYMDRVYTVYQEDVERFYDIANEQGWKYNNIFDQEMVVKFGYDIGRAQDNPYMDTFAFFFREGKHGENYLSNRTERNAGYEEFDFT